MPDLGTVVITEKIVQNFQKVTFAWTSVDGGGDAGKAQKTTVNYYTGELIRLITDPGATAPTDDYDVAINDDDGFDVLLGAGANRDTVNTEQVLASSLGCVVSSKLTLSITNAGNAKVGTVHLYIKAGDYKK